MSMRTKYLVQCVCGHQGTIVLTENDQPYSKPWEKYSLETLLGQESFYVEGSADWAKVFQVLKPVCPKCMSPLFVEALKL